MKVYIGNKSEIFSKPKKKLVDFLFPFYNKEQEESVNLKEKYGAYSDYYELEDSINEADFCLLPFPLNYYYQNHCKQQALQFIKESKKAGKEVVAFTSGDYGVPALDPDIIILRQSGYQSQRLKKQFAMPAFFNDPVDRFFSGNFQVREKNEKPLVGFCGQGASSKLRYAGVFGANLFRNLKFHLRLSASEPQVLYPSTLRRNRALSVFERSPLTDTDFIIRQRYRAGALTEKQRLSTAIEFYNNIRDTDYVLSIRGGGNFSVRIYETLAMGRIPIFINTDCILPYDHLIDWKSHVVWIDEKDLSKGDEILADFHSSIHPDDFVQLQIENRELWKKYLSFPGFYDHFTQLLNLDKQ